MQPGLSVIPDAPADRVTKAKITPALERRRKYQVLNPKVSVQILVFPLSRCVNWGKFWTIKRGWKYLPLRRAVKVHWSLNMKAAPNGRALTSALEPGTAFLGVWVEEVTSLLSAPTWSRALYSSSPAPTLLCDIWPWRPLMPFLGCWHSHGYQRMRLETLTLIPATRPSSFVTLCKLLYLSDSLCPPRVAMRSNRIPRGGA